MIVVIADDLSGAAELAGAALRHGLSAEVQTSFDPASGADVVCVDTDSRLLSPDVAAGRVAEVALRVVAAKPAWIFKKCDSVLRGPVLAEARAVATAASRTRILLVPANPSRDRTIRGGIYHIAGRPLHDTPFAHDPIHPRRTADVKALLGGEHSDVTVPDIASAKDVQLQAECLAADTLPAGAVDFFASLLAVRTIAKVPPVPPPPSLPGPRLLVCGSEASWPQRQNEAAARGLPTFSFPLDLSRAIDALRTGKSVVVGIGNGPLTKNNPPVTLTADLARAVVALLKETPVDAVYLEGGATSAAVIAALGWTRLRAEHPAESGIGILRPIAPAAPLLVIKPGSYPWPASLWP
jgi:uncharacterized protein YgbK (DUF1537 family)